MGKKNNHVYDADVRCPHCYRVNKFRMHTLLDPALDVNTVAKVLRGDYFEHKCSHCGGAQYMSYTCLYHDGSRRVLIGLADTEADTAHMKNQLTGQAGHSRLNDAIAGWLDLCKVRMVKDPLELQEKVLIEELELDDRIVAITKVKVLEKAGVKCDFAMFNTKEDDFVIAGYDEQGKNFELPVTREEYNEIEEQHKELPEGDLVVDLKWAERYLENLQK